jgi:FkbM family methyltransferase
VHRNVWFYLHNVPRRVLDHPNNRQHKLRALGRAAAWQVYRRTSRRPITRPAYGLRIRLYPGSGSAANLVYFGRFYEPSDMMFLDRYLRPGDGFIDGGANIGTYSLLAASRVGPTGWVEAFEPIPQLHARLTENIALNGLEGIVRAHRLALSDTERDTQFTAELDVSNREAWPDCGEVLMPVSCVSLDHHLGDATGFAAAKLDLEGNEHATLLGAQGRLAAADPPVWLVEALPHQSRRSGVSREDVFELLTAAGYRLASYDYESNRIADLEAARRGGWTFLAIHADAWDRVLARLGQAGARR